MKFSNSNPMILKQSCKTISRPTCRPVQMPQLHHHQHHHHRSLCLEPLQKTLNLSEKTKNRILTAEGILLLLCVLLPSTTILLQVTLPNTHSHHAHTGS